MLAVGNRPPFAMTASVRMRVVERLAMKIAEHYLASCPIHLGRIVDHEGARFDGWLRTAAPGCHL